MSHVATVAPQTRAFSPIHTGVLAGLVAAVIWGAYLSLSRAGVASGLDGFDVAFLRYAVAGPVMGLAWVAFKSGQRPALHPGQAVAVALLLGPPFVLLSVGGYAYAPLAHGAVILPATLTLAGFILARVFLGQRLSLGQIIGATAILSGLVLIAGPTVLTGSALALRGDAMFVLAGLFWAGFSVLQQRWKLNAVDVTLVVSLAGLVSVVPAYLVLRGPEVLLALPASMLATQIVVQGTLSGIIAMIAFAQAVKLLGAAKAATFPALVPGFALLIGIPLTMEIPGPLQVAGLAVVALGLLVALTVRRSEPASA
ncbi:DMT family transporter [uncultured Tateyamaria sp.]|uniref:DMT family transporter n=1 Tax=Tateyamaria sp. 1078 TaxID=3417464 RepID=UPI00260193DB|nr:DMT family transporter [uncultured Tateyamaria sp.]